MIHGVFVSTGDIGIGQRHGDTSKACALRESDIIHRQATSARRHYTFVI